MDLTRTQDQELIAATARELLAGRAAAAGARAMAADPAGHSLDLWKEMTGLGWTGLPFADADGGAGGEFLDACLLFEELGRALVPSPLAASVAACGMPIARFGTPDQRARWLGAIAAGHVATAAPLPWDRPGEGPAATADGSGYVLDGVATFVPFAASAENVLVVARLDGEPRAFWVDASEVTPRPVGTLGLDRPCHVDVTGVRVCADDALGGDRAAADAISLFGAAAACAEMVGAAQRVLDLTVAYAGERHQFRKPIGTFQAVQHHCSDMAIDVLGSRFIAYEAIWLLSVGRDASREVATAKAWVSEAYERVCALGHQVHGAIGFTQEHDLHLFSRHAMSAALAHGDAALHLDRLATALDVP
ncbi:acyl-CoA dehydrogenase family protein [Actinomadura algeriensis]|uniref:Alkylation response protein AidB-like acyl-CoA dehydrogenase n=1 Tax=Actinomadura algeriensis TaxID=1679523 RepID=A0ABR9JKX0_9ACTN|nr:acyl-CoA dehydrogenase family protein [Actinomadura algeriensis]MBE1531200.1 alkylation response protein AidB-like acyl-CoA dehydrogenase [Actinomadura algeriensis]